jgi:hypothetical protein
LKALGDTPRDKNVFNRRREREVTTVNSIALKESSPVPLCGRGYTGKNILELYFPCSTLN